MKIYGTYRDVSYRNASIVQGSNSNSFRVIWSSENRPDAIGYINDAQTQGTCNFPDDREYAFSYKGGVIYWDDDGSYTSTKKWTKTTSVVTSVMNGSNQTNVHSSTTEVGDYGDEHNFYGSDTSINEIKLSMKYFSRIMKYKVEVNPCILNHWIKHVREKE